MEGLESPYYPPRARWYSRFLYLGGALRRGMGLDRIHLPPGLSGYRLVLSVAVPGYAFIPNGHPRFGRSVIAVYAVSVILFVVALGYPAGNLAFGLMIGAHATSLIFMEGYWLRAGCGFPLRCALAVATLLLVWQGAYGPAIGFVQSHWVMPLRIRDHVVVVRRTDRDRVPAIRPGQRVIYSMHAAHNELIHNQAVYVNGGIGWGEVLATGGDVVEFSATNLAVNGRKLPRLPHMPASGSLVVAEKHWFIWPDLAIGGHGEMADSEISAMMLQLAIVPERQYVGQPFAYWFGRKQIFQ